MPPDWINNELRRQDRAKWDRDMRASSQSAGGCIFVPLAVLPFLIGGFVVLVLVVHFAFSGRSAVEAENSPQAVLIAYVQASLSVDDEHAAAALTCRAPHLDNIRSWQHDLAVRRQQLGLPPWQASVISYHDTKTDEIVTATAAVAVTLAVDGQSQSRETRPYTFTLTHEDGWKVCTATPAG